MTAEERQILEEQKGRPKGTGVVKICWLVGWLVCWVSGWLGGWVVGWVIHGGPWGYQMFFLRG